MVFSLREERIDKVITGIYLPVVTCISGLFLLDEAFYESLCVMKENEGYLFGQSFGKINK